MASTSRQELIVFTNFNVCTKANLITDLSAAVDVYSDWVDACDAVAKDAADGNDEDWQQGMASRTAHGDSDLEPNNFVEQGTLSDDDVEPA